MQLSHNAEQIAISASNKVTVGGAVTAGGSWFAEKTEAILSMTGPEVINFCAIGGFAITVVGFGFSLYFQLRRNRREREAHDALMEQMRLRNQVSDSL